MVQWIVLRGGSGMLCTQRVVLQMLATEALTTEGEDGGGIKEAVERAEQRVVLAEDFPPVGGILVAREDHVERAFFVVAAVHHVEEQARVRLVEFAVTNLIDNQAGRPDEAGKERALSARAAGDGELVTQLGRLDEVRLHAVAAALVAERLRKMRLARPRRPDERDVLVRVDGSQRLEILELVDVLAFQDVEIEVVKRLDLLLRQAAGAQEHLDSGLLLLVPEIFEHRRHGLDGFRGKGTFLCQLREFFCREVQPQQLVAPVDGAEQGVSHRCPPPC